MNMNSFRASAFAGALALLASPAVADRVSIAVTNNTGFAITQMYLDGAQLANYTVERLDGGTIESGSRREFGIESDSTCQYDIYTMTSGGTASNFRFTIEGCGSGGVTVN
ncbi:MULTISPECIES: hypothetical protein [Nioella]|jgi:hypothetical protein|uniref:hypothetical protein n=1 Tax=Nioella TaxID=1775424 RepID=UPI000FD71313|nr:hypothetical protein [Nioella ostreopsis]